MTAHKLREITIVTTASHEARLCEQLREWGARGYSILQSVSHSSRAFNTGKLEDEYVRIEALVSDEIAKAVMEGLQQAYFRDSSVVCFVSDILVRPLTAQSSSPTFSGGSPREELWGDYVITI